MIPRIMAKLFDTLQQETCLEIPMCSNKTMHIYVYCIVLYCIISYIILYHILYYIIYYIISYIINDMI